MHALDLSLIAFYFLIVFIIGVWAGGKVKDSDDLFLAGRSLKWPVIGLSLFASNISSTTIIGLAGAAYSVGIAVANYEWMASLVLIFMCLFCIPVFLKSKITTMPELLEKRFDHRARAYYSAITIFLSILVDTAGGLYAGALAIGIFFPQLNVWETCIGLSIFAGLYTAVGGLKAVVYTDAIQAIILLVGSTLLTWIVFGRVDYSWSSVIASYPEGHFSFFKPNSDPDMPWLGLISGVPLLGFWYWGTNQYITQRILAAQDIENARWGALLGAALKLIPLFTMVLPGAMAIQLFPGLQNPDLVYPTLIKELLPIGVTGLIIAGLVAAIMSSIDSTLNSASTLVLHDLLPRFVKQTNQQPSVWVGRITTLSFMTLAAVWAPMIASFGGLFSYLQQSYAVLVPPVVTIYVMGLFSARGGGRLALQTLIFGHSLGALLFTLSYFELIKLHFTMSCGITTLLCFIFYNAFASRKPSAKGDIGFHWQDLKPSRPVNLIQDYRLWSAILIMLIGLILYLFSS